MLEDTFAGFSGLLLARTGYRVTLPEKSRASPVFETICAKSRAGDSTPR